ncbi:MAG: hypothetical protein WC718_00605 [Phycisphaerales bacterium]|jgi:hypothetical protein
MESLLVLMKLLGIACLSAGTSLLAARVLRVDRVFAWLSRVDLKPWRLALATLSLVALGGAALIVTGLVPVDFSRLIVGLGLWFMIAGPMLAWPILTSGREPTDATAAASHPMPQAAREATPARRAA